MAADYLLQEDGVSKIILEDASGDLILESSAGAFVGDEEGLTYTVVVTW